MPIFGSILPISLQQIASEKIYTVHSNELVLGYTLIPMTMHIVKYLGGDIVKLVDFSCFVFVSICLTLYSLVVNA